MLQSIAEKVVSVNPNDLTSLRFLAKSLHNPHIGLRDLVRARGFALRAAECIGSGPEDWMRYVELTAPYFGDGTAERAAVVSYLHRAAEAGLASAQHKHGMFLVDAVRCGELDGSVALQWLEKAAAQGFADSMFAIACLFYDPRSALARTRADRRKYEAWLRRAAKVGHLSAMAELSESLLDPEADGPSSGSRAREEEGRRLMFEAAGRGHARSSWNAFVRLQDADEDFTRALPYLDRAAAAGFPQAVLALADIRKLIIEAELEQGGISAAEAGARLAEIAAQKATAEADKSRSKEGLCPCGRVHAQGDC